MDELDQDALMEAMVNDLTDEQALALTRSRKLRAALREAPAVAEHLRSRVHHSAGRTERGDFLSEARTPLLSWIADDADALYVTIVEWVRAWSMVVDAPAPTSAVVAWRRYQLFEDGTRGSNVLGFPAWATSQDAHDLVAASTRWLLKHADEIDRDSDAATYQEDLADKVWRLRAGYGLLEARPVREGTPRRCLACGEDAVQAEFFRGSLSAAELRGEALIDEASGIEIRCSSCSDVSATRPGEVARWLTGTASAADRRLRRSVRTRHGRVIPSSATTAWKRFSSDGYYAVAPVNGPRRETREEAMKDAIEYWEAVDDAAPALPSQSTEQTR